MLNIVIPYTVTPTLTARGSWFVSLDTIILQLLCSLALCWRHVVEDINYILDYMSQESTQWLLAVFSRGLHGCGYCGGPRGGRLSMMEDAASTGPGHAVNASGVDASGVLLCVDCISAPSVCCYLVSVTAALCPAVYLAYALSLIHIWRCRRRG